MYPEFIPVYIGIAVLLVLAVVILIMLVKISKKVSGMKNQPNVNTYGGGMPNRSAAFQVAFCNRCGAQYDASTQVCPKCGTPRS